MKLLHEHGDASINAMQQFTKYYRGACHQIRYLGLTPSATEKKACFLLESAVHGQETPKGMRFNLTLTHEEIAQVVGVTRETVTRALAELRTKMLISTKGPSVLIRNKPALGHVTTCRYHGLLDCWWPLGLDQRAGINLCWIRRLLMNR
jgi:CRP/FNR family transcriptional regulator